MTLGRLSVSGDKANLGQDARPCLDADRPRDQVILVGNRSHDLGGQPGQMAISVSARPQHLRIAASSRRELHRALRWLGDQEDPDPPSNLCED